VPKESLSAEPLAGGCCRIGARDARRGLVEGMYALTLSTFAFRKRAWETGGGLDPEITSCCDFDFLERVTRRHDIGFVDEPLIEWHIREDSLLRTSTALVRCCDRIIALASLDGSALGETASRRLTAQLLAEAWRGAQTSRASKRYLCMAGFRLGHLLVRGGGPRLHASAVRLLRATARRANRERQRQRARGQAPGEA
jgi:hypothetical protein